MRSSSSSAHVRTEIPIHIPMLPPMSDIKFSICGRESRKVFEWPEKAEKNLMVPEGEGGGR